MIPKMSLVDKAAVRGTEDLSSEQPFKGLDLWWRWVSTTAGLCALAWVVTAFWLTTPIIGLLSAGLPFVVMAVWLGRAQRSLLQRYLPFPGAAGRPPPYKGWRAGTAIGFLVALVAPYMLWDAVVPRFDPAEVTGGVLLIGAAAGAVIGIGQGAVLFSRWRPAWPFWAVVNTVAVALAALAWWLVFAVVRAGGPPTDRGSFGPVFTSSDVLSLIVGGAAGSLVFALITALGLAWLGARCARAGAGRALMRAAGLTALGLSLVLGLSLPASATTTRTVTTVLNPHRVDPTPTIAPAMLGVKTQQVTASVCGAWYYTSSPVGAPDGRRMSTSVDAISDSEAWASYGLSMLHWRGNQWQLLELPGLGQGSLVNSIEAVSADDVWAAGYKARSAQPGDAGWIAHWDGKRWSNVAIPGMRGEPNAMAATGPDDVWAVGIDGSTEAPANSIFHWNGQAWTVVPNLDTISRGLYSDVAAVSPDDAWAVGSSYNSESGSSVPVTIHWDGKAWRAASDSASGERRAVAATSPNDVWVAGRDPLLSHWDGKVWQPIPEEQIRVDLRRGGGLAAVAANSPTDVWAAGSERSTPLLLHWDGSRWSRVPSPAVAGGWIDVAVSQGTVWAVGWNGGVPDRQEVPLLGRFLREACPSSRP